MTAESAPLRRRSSVPTFATLGALEVLLVCSLVGAILGDLYGGEPVLESDPVAPVALAPGGELLAVANPPDGRVELFVPRADGPTRVGEVVVGLEPVALAFRGGSELWVANQLSDSVCVVDVTDPARAFVRATVAVGDEPRGLAIGGGDRDLVLVATARRGQARGDGAALTTAGVGRADLWIIDASRPDAPARIVSLFGDAPRALAVSADGRLAHVAVFRSGNGTTTLHEQAVDPFWTLLIDDGFVAPGLPPPRESADGERGPSTGLIVSRDPATGAWRDDSGRDWSPRLRFALPDLDVFSIDLDADPPQVVRSHAGVGTTLLGLAESPVDGSLWVAHVDARNQVRLEPRLRGHVVDHRITILRGDARRVIELNAHIDRTASTGSEHERALSIATPIAIAFDPSRELALVAAYESALLAAIDAEGRILERVPVAAGPCGIAVDSTRRRAYVLGRFELELSVVDLDTLEEIDRLDLRFHPESAAVRQGRALFHDARRSSAHGDASCASCHLFGHLDALAWDLGDPDGRVEAVVVPPVPVPDAGLAVPHHPLKGPMLTQSLRGLRGAGAMHWRGDRHGGSDTPLDERAALRSFVPTFGSLLGREAPFDAAELERIADWVLALAWPPSPVARLDGSESAAERAGRELFESRGDPLGVGGDGNPCVTCHALPLGTSARATSTDTQVFEVPHLRGLWERVGMFGTALPTQESFAPSRLTPTPTPFLGDQVRGFGFSHDGSFPTLVDFLAQPRRLFVFPDEPGRSGRDKARQLEAFLLAFPTGLAAAVGQQVTLDERLLDTALARWQLLRSRALAGDGDLVAHGLLDGEQRGWLLSRLGADEPPRLRWLSDREGDTLAPSALLDAVRTGRLRATATLVPPGAGRRRAIDRDGDGALDGDERALGTDPADPSSSPRLAPLVSPGDCNLDGRADVSDAVTALGALFLGPPLSCGTPCDTSGDGRVDVSDPISLLSFLFGGGPAPSGWPRCVVGGPSCPEACTDDAP